MKMLKYTHVDASLIFCGPYIFYSGIDRLGLPPGIPGQLLFFLGSRWHRIPNPQRIVR